jgi:hypothetical protein
MGTRFRCTTILPHGWACAGLPSIYICKRGRGRWTMAEHSRAIRARQAASPIDAKAGTFASIVRRCEVAFRTGCHRMGRPAARWLAAAWRSALVSAIDQADAVFRHVRSGSNSPFWLSDHPSGLPQTTDIAGPGRRFAFGPTTEVAYSITSSAGARPVGGSVRLSGGVQCHCVDVNEPLAGAAKHICDLEGAPSSQGLVAWSGCQQLIAAPPPRSGLRGRRRCEKT